MTQGRVAAGARLAPRAAAALIVAACASGCARPLPEAESAAAQLYTERCGSCHVPHHPQTLTRSMWRVQVDRMDSKFRGAGLRPPEGDERARILDYLTRNAGG